MSLVAKVSKAKQEADDLRAKLKKALKKMAKTQTAVLAAPQDVKAQKAYSIAYHNVRNLGMNLGGAERALGELRARVPFELPQVISQLFRHAKGEGDLSAREASFLESERAALERIATDIRR